jgi:hypothetical protein
MNQLPKQGTWWTFRGDQQGCGKSQQVVESSTSGIVTWGNGFSWFGPTNLFFQLFTPDTEKSTV